MGKIINILYFLRYFSRIPFGCNFSENQYSRDDFDNILVPQLGLRTLHTPTQSLMGKIINIFSEIFEASSFWCSFSDNVVFVPQSLF